MLSRRLQSSTVVRAAGLTIVAAMLTALPGCSTISSMMPKAREAKQTQLEMRQLQAKCMRFADEYVGSVVEETTRFQRAFVDPELRQVHRTLDPVAGEFGLHDRIGRQRRRERARPRDARPY